MIIKLIKLATAVAPIVVAVANRPKKPKRSNRISDHIYNGLASGRYTEEQAKEMCKENNLVYPPLPLLKRK